MTEQEEFRHDPYPDPVEGGTGAGPMAALVAVVLMLAVVIYLNSQVKPDVLPDHCHPTNWGRNK